MVSVAILGLTLTVILSAQGGLAASNKSANNMGIATSLGRCKMTELEEKLLRLGYPEVDDLQTDVSCCDDRDNPPFTCDTRVETKSVPPSGIACCPLSIRFNNTCLSWSADAMTSGS